MRVLRAVRALAGFFEQPFDSILDFTDLVFVAAGGLAGDGSVGSDQINSRDSFEAAAGVSEAAG